MAGIATSVTAAYTFQTLTGPNIADQYVSVGPLSSGDNTVTLPADIVAPLISAFVALCPDDVVILVKSFSQVTMTPSSPLAYNPGTTYAAAVLVTYNGLQYVSLAGSNTGNTPGSSPTWWQPGNSVMTQVVLNAASTASSGCTLLVKVGTD